MPRQPRNLHFVATWHSSDNAIRKSTQHTTRLKCCACHAKWRWTRPKCCACHENCNASSENVAKVLRLLHKTTLDALQNTSECHEVPRLPRETKQHDVCKLQMWPLARTYYRYGHTGLTRSPANGCERLGNIEWPHPQPSGPRVKREPSLRIRE